MDDMEEQRVFFKEWRIYAGLTQDQLGERLGITGAQVSRIETGKRDFTGEYCRKFQKALNLPECRHFADPLYAPPDPEGILHDVETRRMFDQLRIDLRDRISDLVNARRENLPVQQDISTKRPRRR